MPLDRILLIAPPAFTGRLLRDINPFPPMGLGYLASMAESVGIQVQILDCLMLGWNHEELEGGELVRVGLSDKEIQNYILRFKPNLVGVNCQFSKQHRIYHRMFSLVKELDPSIVVVAGGPHATVCPEAVLQDSNCDYLISGEGEYSFRDLIVAIRGGTGTAHIDGLGWKTGNSLHFNSKHELILDLDSLPFPAHHLMNLDKYFGLHEESHGIRHRKRFCPIITSRGCPANCTFCSACKVWGDKYRMRSVENVLEEMRLLKSQYGIEEILFEDDNVTANPKRAKLLFSRMIAEKLGFIWDTPNGAGVWSMDEEMIDLMKESGCISLNFPVESGSPRVLKQIIRKPLDLSRVRRLTRYCKKIGLRYSMYLVIGMPGEQLSEMWESFRFAAECGCYSPHVSVATPYPGTQLHENCVKDGLFAAPFSLDNLSKGFLIKTTDWNEEDLRRLLLKGMLYLKVRNMLDNPYKIFEFIAKALMNPKRFVHICQDILNSRWLRL